ncbi:MAG TPA: hypothetical protein DCX95_04170 [Elusimicrobia bacterium]|nr:hypothetical protein [Elusimicrobiota bacterium]
MVFILYVGILNKEKLLWFLKNFFGITGAFLIPMLLVVLYFFKADAFNDFQYQVFQHNIGYINSELTMDNFFQSIRFILQSQWILWTLLVFGIVAIFRQNKTLQFKLLILWFIFSAIGVSLGKRFVLHYFQQIMPPLALLACTGFFSLVFYINQRKKKPISAGTAFILILFLIVAVPVCVNYKYFTYSLRQNIFTVYSENPFIEAVTAANFLKKETTPKDKIFIVGSEPQILFYANRRSVSKYIFFYPLTGNFSDTLLKQKEVILEINKELPKFIVYVNYVLSLGADYSTPKYIFEKIGELLIQRYEIVGIVNPQYPEYIYTGDALEKLIISKKDIFKDTQIFIYRVKTMNT